MKPRRTKTWKDELPTTPAEWSFLIWLIVAPITLLVTGFLPIILSIYHNNWLYMSMYAVIGLPILLELIVFVIWFKLIKL